MWSGLNDFQDPKLKELAEKLPDIVMHSREDATVKQYRYGFQRWKLWAAQFEEIKALPASPMHVSLYLVSIMQYAKTSSPVTTAFYSISWAHKLAGVQDPTDHVLPKRVKESALRKLGHGKNKKEPVTPEMLSNLVQKYASDSATLSDLRLVVMCLIAFTAFMRFDELSSIRAQDIEFEVSYFRIFVERAKNDVYREGNWVLIARLGGKNCPYSLLQRYLKSANIELNSEEYIFRSLSFLKSSNSYILRKKGKISYTRTREIILDGFKSLGYDISKIGTHSLRAGGASKAANNGVPDRLFKKHGRWSSEKAKDIYVKEDIDKRLSVSLSLGL